MFDLLLITYCCIDTRFIYLLLYWFRIVIKVGILCDIYFHTILAPNSTVLNKTKHGAFLFFFVQVYDRMLDINW